MGERLEVSMLDQRIDYQIQISNANKSYDEIKAGDISHPSLFGGIADYEGALKKLKAIKAHNPAREYRLIKTTITLELVDEN